MIKKIKNMNFLELKKFMYEKGFKISRVKRKPIDKRLKNLYFTSLASIFLIAFFFILPKTSFQIAEFLKEPNEIQNNSKKYFNDAIANKKTNKLQKKLNLDEGVDFENLFDDIFILDQSSKSSVRLPASTLEQLFKDEKYNLKDVRKNKIVKPIVIGLLPKEIRKIENVKKRKEFFIKIVLPLVLEENNKIKLNRKRLFVILNKNNNTQSEKDWLNKMFKQYGVLNKDLSTLKIRMDVIPVSLAIAQAAKETGWGTSRFALEGNALFGQWTFSGNGIKPAGASDDTNHKVMKFKVLKASVRAYQRNLNTHSGYRDFRKARAIQRDNQKKLNSLELVDYLDRYAETGKEYTKILKKIIKQNSLNDFDDAKILPSSKQAKDLKI